MRVDAVVARNGGGPKYAELRIHVSHFGVQLVAAVVEGEERDEFSLTLRSEEARKLGEEMTKAGALYAEFLAWRQEKEATKYERV